MKNLFASMGLLLALVACGSHGSGGDGSNSGPLVIEESSALAVRGTFASEGGALSFRAALDEGAVIIEVRDEVGELVSSHLEDAGHAFAFAGVPVAAVSGTGTDLAPVVALVDSERWASFEALVEALERALPHDDSPSSMLRKAFTDARVTAELVAEAGSGAEGDAGYNCWCMQWTTYCHESPECMSNSQGSCPWVCVSDCTRIWCEYY